VTYTVDGERKTKRCTPDSFWCIDYRGHRHGGLYEFDNSTMAGTTKTETSRIFEKLEALWQLWLKWRERGFTDRLGVDSLRLFYVTKSEQRKENIRELARSVGDQRSGSDFFWFACQKAYQDNPFNVLSHTWQTPRDDTHKAIFGNSAGEIAGLTHDTLGPTPPLSLDPDTLRLPFTQPVLREATHLDATATTR
jgi:hypothetical protein